MESPPSSNSRASQMPNTPYPPDRSTSPESPLGKHDTGLELGHCRGVPGMGKGHGECPPLSAHTA